MLHLMCVSTRAFVLHLGCLSTKACGALMRVHLQELLCLIGTCLSLIACAVLVRVCLQELCAVPVYLCCVCGQELVLHLRVFVFMRFVLHLKYTWLIDT
jgi:hypothetical protein